MCVNTKNLEEGDKVLFKKGAGRSRLEIVCRVVSVNGATLILQPVSTRKCGEEAETITETFSASARHVS